VQKPSFKRAARSVVVAVLCVLLVQVSAAAEEPGQVGEAVETTAAAATTLAVETTTATVVETTLAEPTTTQPPVSTEPPTTLPPTTEPPTTEPPTTVPPTTEPPTTAPPTTTEPPTTAPPTTQPPTTASGPVIGPNTLPPPAGGGGSPSSPGAPAAIGSGPAASESGPTGAFKSAIGTLGSTAATVGSTVTTAARRMVLPAVRKLARVPAVRKLAQSQPVAATKQAVRFVTEELSQLEPARVATFLWLALLALLVSCGAFLRLWWAPVDWPSTRSLAVGAHRRAGQQPRRPVWPGWPAAAPPRRSRGRSGWQPPAPGATGLTPRRSPQGIGIDVGRLRSHPPAPKPVFTGDDQDPDDGPAGTAIRQ
jgi:hypothetical protein